MYCGWLVIELVFIVTYIVETKGRTLEETAVLFDGEQSPQDLAQMGGEAATMTMGRGNGAEERLSEEKEMPIARDFMELQDVSFNGSSADEMSGYMTPEIKKARDHCQLYRIDEHCTL